MKVAIPTTDKKTIFGHTGHADYFLVLTIEDNKIIDQEFRRNPHSEEEGHGDVPDHEPGSNHNDHDHHHDHDHSNNHMHHNENAHDIMIEKISDCKYFIVRHVGRRCAPSLKKFNIKPLLVKGHGEIFIEEVLPEVVKLPVEQ